MLLGIMLTIMEFSLYYPQQMTADGLHHCFRSSGLPTWHTTQTFISQVVAESQLWAEGLRRRSTAVELEELVRFCSRCGLARLLLPDFAHLYVQWLTVDGGENRYRDGTWLGIAESHCCLVDLLTAFERSVGGV